MCNVNADSSEDYAIAVMRKLRDGSEKMMGHLGDEHAMDITALMSMFNNNSKLLYCRKANAITIDEWYTCSYVVVIMTG